MLDDKELQEAIKIAGTVTQDSVGDSLIRCLAIKESVLSPYIASQIDEILNSITYFPLPLKRGLAG